MSQSTWQTSFWPEGVPHHITDYHYPITDILDKTAEDYPENIFTLFSGKGKTYAQVKDTADRVANFLAENGIEKGDRVALFLPNIPQYPEILFGVLKAGGVCVNCNPMYTPSELNHQLGDSGARMIFCMDHQMFYDHALKAIENTDVKTVITCNIRSYLPWSKAFLGGLLGKLPAAKNRRPEDLKFDDVVADAAPTPPDIVFDPETDAAIMLYTGGTTGVPKGVELTHTNFTYDVKAAHTFFQVSHQEGEAPAPMHRDGSHTMMGVLPWYHSFGLTGALLFSAYTASSIVCIPDPRAGNPPFTDLLKAIQKHRPTFMVAVPTLLVAINTHPQLKKFDLSSLLACLSGGAPLPPEVCTQFEEKTGATLFEAYGLTETAPCATCNPASKNLRRVGSIGFPIPDTDVKIVDIETGTRSLERETEGELAVSGPQVMKGYWKRPDANADVFRTLDGRRYFLTGDIARIDKDGYIHITDRKKDMILVGGFNVYPREVEDILYGHPGVELAAVVGIPDRDRGETVKAFIKPRDGYDLKESDLIEFCKANMAGYKRPRIFELTDDIPLSNIGKVLRRSLRERELSESE